MIPVFHSVKATQLVCCFVVLCFVLSTTELRGRLVTRDGQNQTLLTRQLKSRGGSCDRLLFYLPTRHQQYLLQSTTAANSNNIKHRGQRAVEPTAAAEEQEPRDQKQQDEDEDGDGDGSGRIVLVFDGSSVRTNEKLNTTDELRLHAFLLFEWNSNNGNIETGVSAPNGSDVKSQPGSGEWLSSAETNSTKSGIKCCANVEAPDGNQIDDEVKQQQQQNGGQNADGGGLLPEGEYAFKICKIDGVTNGRRSSSQLGMDDPFHAVARRLFVLAVICTLQMIYSVAHIILRGANDTDSGTKTRRTNDANREKKQAEEAVYSNCEIVLLLISYAIWIVVTMFAAEMMAKWEQRWQCTNFRPERPSIFYLAFPLALVSLFVLEGCFYLPTTVDSLCDSFEVALKSREDMAESRRLRHVDRVRAVPSLMKNVGAGGEEQEEEEVLTIKTSSLAESQGV